MRKNRLVEGQADGNCHEWNSESNNVRAETNRLAMSSERNKCARRAKRKEEKGTRYRKEIPRSLAVVQSFGPRFGLRNGAVDPLLADIRNPLDDPLIRQEKLDGVESRRQCFLVLK